MDDVADVRSLARLVLEADGRFDVVAEAANGVEAVAMARATQPDVVVLDLAMPLMDGAEALAAIRRDAPATKILLVSGVAATEQPGRRVGADGYLEKRVFARELPDTAARLWAGGTWCARLRASSTVAALAVERTPTVRPVSFHWQGGLRW